MVTMIGTFYSYYNDQYDYIMINYNIFIVTTMFIVLTMKKT